MFDIEEVTIKSSLSLRLCVRQFARYFMREGYSDFLHYDIDDKQDNPVAFLFFDSQVTDREMRQMPIGACLFRYREYENVPVGFWTMHWAWIHPYKRHKGILSEHVQKFNDQFGYWFPETPHSKAMQSFIKKHKMVHPFKKFNVQHVRDDKKTSLNENNIS